MKLAFATLGCTQWDIDTIIARAVEYGYDGVDFRGYLGEMEIFKLPEFATGLDDTISKFEDAGLEVPCLSTSARVYANPAEALEEIAAYCPLCERLGAPYMRVFAGHLEDGV
ncbi:MAG: sugar phosphate isomerase/epimerase, partial [Hyphomicrobiales bacterium]